VNNYVEMMKMSVSIFRKSGREVDLERNLLMVLQEVDNFLEEVSTTHHKTPPSVIIMGVLV